MEVVGAVASVIAGTVVVVANVINEPGFLESHAVNREAVIAAVVDVPGGTRIRGFADPTSPRSPTPSLAAAAPE